MALQLRRGTEAERTAGGGIVFAEGELVYITDTEEVYVGDGVTAGGIRVTGSVVGSPANLTQNLNMNNFDILGTGNINITGTITASNISGGGGLIEGQEYAIDVMGDIKGADSSIIVDHQNGIVYADFVGDGSLITGITQSTLEDTNIVNPQFGDHLVYKGGFWINESGSGLTEGQTYDINITGDIVYPDSTVAFDNLNSTLTLDYIKPTDNFITLKRDTGILEVRFESPENKTRMNFYAVNDTGDLSAYADYYGVVNFGKRDTNGTRVDGTIRGANSDMRLSHDTVSTLLDDETKYFTLKDGNFGFGTYTPADKVQINGNLKFVGGSIRFDITRLYTGITPVTGELMYDNNEGAMMLRTSTGWSKLVGTEVTSETTVFSGPIFVGGVTQADVDASDDSGANGFIAYNTDSDKMTFYQSGSFTELPNNGTQDGQLLQWSTADNAWNPTQYAEPQTGQVLTWNGTHWSPQNADFAAGGGTGGSGFTNIGVYADDSGIRLIYEGESFGILGGTGITTASVEEGSITINGFSGDFADLANVPTTLAGYGITDDIVIGSELGNFTFTTSTLDTSDSSGITITPPVTMNSDLTVENNLTVTNTITADRFVSTSTGTPEIEAAANLNLTAGNAVVVTSSPLRMASFTTAERDALASTDGDMIYNTTTNKFQGYANGAWVDLH